MHLVASLRLFVCQFVSLTITSLRYLSVSLNLGAIEDNLADAVDRLLILRITLLHPVGTSIIYMSVLLQLISCP